MKTATSQIWDRIDETTWSQVLAHLKGSIRIVNISIPLNAPPTIDNIVGLILIQIVNHNQITDYNP